MRLPQVVFADCGQIYVLTSAPSNVDWRPSAYDIEVPCVVLWRMLRCTALTSLNNDSPNHVVTIEKSDKVVNMAIETSIICLFWRRHPPRSSFLEAQKLIMVQCITGWVLRLVMEMNGWDLEERPDLLPESEDDGQDIELGAF